MNFDFECSISEIHRVKATSGCYAICENGRIMYIGRSVNLRARLKTRKYDKWCYSGTSITDRARTSVIYEYAPEDATVGVWYFGDYKSLEADLICNIEPKMNKSIPTCGAYGEFLTERAKLILSK